MSPAELLRVASTIADAAARLAKHVAEGGADDPDELLPLADAARVARVSERTLLSMIVIGARSRSARAPGSSWPTRG